MPKHSAIRTILPVLLSAMVFAISARAFGTEFYVSPNGSSSGDGSVFRPWDLATALAQPLAVHPGDTIWLRGGIYTFPQAGNILCGLQGTATAPIIVAQYPGERATLDIKGSAQGLFFTTSPNLSGAAYVRFKDFEVTNTDTNRVPGMPAAIYVRTSDHLSFINLVVHDTGEAFALTPDAVNTEVYGCLVYYNGALSGQEHGIYIQNVSGYKKAVDNIVFNNAGYGIHAFPHATDSSLLNVTVSSNILFNNGSLGSNPPAPDLLVGGEAVAISPMIDSNATYKSSPGAFWNQQFGFGAGCVDANVTNNYFVGATLLTNCLQNLALTGNTFYGLVLTRPSGDGVITALNAGSYPGNKSLDIPSPTVIVRPNLYESGRANIAVYNWDQREAVDVDLAAVLNAGDYFEIRNAEDYFGPVVLKGVYDGRSIRLPMTGLSRAAPVGFPTPSENGPEFRVFVLSVALRGRAAVRPPKPGRPSPQTIRR